VYEFVDEDGNGEVIEGEDGAEELLETRGGAYVAAVALQEGRGVHDNA